jgi:hypothetical protein
LAVIIRDDVVILSDPRFIRVYPRLNLSNP